MDIELKGKRALVTGANSGVGRAIVRAYIRAGAQVAINYVAHPGAARNLVEELTREGGQGFAYRADVSDPEAVSTMFAGIDDVWGGLDILVNCAGIDGPRELAWEARISEWRRVIETNLFGAFYCAQEALRRMVPAGSGVVINLTSVHEQLPWSGYSAYTASKAGLGMLTKTLAQEAGRHGVRVLALAPGAIQSPINRSVLEDKEGLAQLLTRIPTERLGDPEDVAGMAVVLASDAARYITGTTVYVDGGMSLFPGFTHWD